MNIIKIHTIIIIKTTRTTSVRINGMKIKGLVNNGMMIKNRYFERWTNLGENKGDRY